MKLIQLSKLLDPRKPLRPVLKNTTEYLELVDSIRKDGVLQPILVRPRGDKYEIVEGNYRFHASKEAGLTEIPALVRELTDEQVQLFQLKANAIRPKTRRADYAKRLQELINSGHTIQTLAAEINKSTSWVKSMLRLTKLCREAGRLVNDGLISMANASQLAKLPHAIQPELLEDAVIKSSDAFKEIARVHLKAHRERIKRGRIENDLDPTPMPHLRSMKEIRREVDTYSQAGVQIKLQDANTALDGWKACLRWLLHLDPVSLQEQLEKQKRAEVEYLTAVERRKRDRELRIKLLENPS